jgi:hypothetical protein
MRSLVLLDLPLQEESDRPNIMGESDDEDEDDAETTSINESDTGSQEL